MKMTVPATSRRSSVYLGNDAATGFAFTFKVFDKEDLQVVITSAAGVVSTPVLDSDYSVALNVDQISNPGGTVTYPIDGDPLPTGAKLVIVGALPYDQTTDLPDGGNYRAEAVENALDRGVMQVQQLAVQVDASVRGPAGESLPPLPSSTDRAGKLLGFDVDGNPETIAPASGSAADLAAQLSTGFNAPIFAERYTAGFGAAADYPIAGLHINKTATGHAHYGVLDNTRYDFTGSADPIIGSASYNDNTVSEGSLGYDHHHSFQSYPHYGTTAQLNVLSSFWSLLDVTAGGVTEASGVKINNPTGAGAIGTMYGVLIEQITRGNDRWGVFVKGTKSFFGGPVWLGASDAPQGYIEYNSATGHIQVRPRPTYGFKIGGDAGERKLLLGVTADDSANASIENAADGHLKIAPRSTFNVLVQSKLQIGATPATAPTIEATGVGRLEITQVAGAGAAKVNGGDFWIATPGNGILLTNPAGTITKRVSLSADGLSLVLT